MEKTGAPRRRMKNRVSLRTNITLVAVCTAVAVGLIILVLYLCGIRYVKYNFKDGFSVKFIGVTDLSGYPKKGRISYSGSGEINGVTGTVNSENGTIEYSNGDVYEGEYEDDNRSGNGTYTFASGEVYTGQFKNNTMWGKGTLTYPDGRRYEGYFEDGLIVRAEDQKTDTDTSADNGSETEGTDTQS